MSEDNPYEQPIIPAMFIRPEIWVMLKELATPDMEKVCGKL